jgi:hypothetical protein
VIRAFSIVLLVIATLPAQAQERIWVRDAGPGASGRILRSVLAGPRVVIRPADSTLYEMPRDTVYTSSVVIIGADVTVESTVRGDLIVVDGDLFLHPGANISGRAVAIGGGVYNSALAVVRGGTRSFRDNTFDAFQTAQGLALDYRAVGRRDTREFILPGLYGIRIPSYNRVNGLSLPFGPTFIIRPGPIEIDPLITWRSDLGEIDPSIDIGAEPDRRFRFELSAGRGTFTNDAWIRGDIMNSLTSIALGTDTRNYYRADRVLAKAHRRWESVQAEIIPYVGGRTESAWSVGPEPGTQSAPWSAFGRTDTLEGMRRPNPPILKGRITSALVGARFNWESAGVQLTVRQDFEIPFSPPEFLGSDPFTLQSTSHGEVKFPTFGTQSFELTAHGVGTFGGYAPPQRFAYLGGAGTLPTFDLLEMGGDHLLFVESLYHIPIDRIVIRYVGSPTFSLRHAFGSAGLGWLPEYEQNIGARLTIAMIRFDYTIDPRSKESEFSIGLALFR